LAAFRNWSDRRNGRGDDLRAERRPQVRLHAIEVFERPEDSETEDAMREDDSHDVRRCAMSDFPYLGVAETKKVSL